jgi:ribonuclease HIII
MSILFFYINIKQENNMNQLVEQNLSNLVQELTTSGSKTLNDEKIKQLKQICK